MALSKDQILSAVDRPTRTVNVPEWGGDVVVRSISAKERADYTNSLMELDSKGEYRYKPGDLNSKLLARCLADEDGNRLFSDDEIDALGQKSAAVLDRLFKVAEEMNGLGDKAVDDAKGNSDAAQSGDSSSD